MSTVKITVRCFIGLILMIVCSACEQNISQLFVREGIALPLNRVPTKWTVMIYMAADNTLESNAIRVMNELETCNFDNNGIKVLSLFDRNDGNDGTNGDWKSTKLFEISKDDGGLNGVIVSKELFSQELALLEGTSTELDMSNPTTLKNFLQYGYTHYPAEKYALIIWGHGNGWRTIISDNYTDTTMPLIDVRNAISGGLNGNVLDYIAFDTSFGTTLEIMWELKTVAQYFSGMPGTMSFEGWNYNEIFTSFMSSQMKSTDLRNAFNTQDGTVTIELKYADEIKKSFDAFTALVAENINTHEKQSLMLDLFFSEVDSYTPSLFPGDLFLDIYSMATVIADNSAILVEHENDKSMIKSAAADLQQILSASVSMSATEQIENHSLSVFFLPLISEKIPSSAFPDEYIQSSGNQKISFVQENIGWVPTEKANMSVLDKLFFTAF